MLDLFIFSVFFIGIFLVPAVIFFILFSRSRLKKIFFNLRSRIAPQAKVTNLGFGFSFVYDNFTIEMYMVWGAAASVRDSLVVYLTGKFPKQKMFMLSYPLVADGVHWNKNKLMTSIRESELTSEDVLYDSVIARLNLMVDAARELEAKNK